MNFDNQQSTTTSTIPQGQVAEDDIRRRAPLEFALICAANAEVYARRALRTATKSQMKTMERILAALHSARLSFRLLEGSEAAQS